MFLLTLKRWSKRHDNMMAIVNDIPDDDTRLSYAAMRLKWKPVCDRSHVFKAKMATVPIPIKESCSSASESMSSYCDFS